MLDDGQLAGMMGMVLSERSIEGIDSEFCNLHIWRVREDYGGRSLALLRPIPRLKE